MCLSMAKCQIYPTQKPENFDVCPRGMVWFNLGSLAQPKWFALGNSEIDFFNIAQNSLKYLHFEMYIH